jgi:NADH-quinone oxidoreductase subunit J
MSGPEIVFFILAGLLVVSSVLVVLQRDVVYCAMALVAALFLIAILFITLHAPMVGVLQILIYAGAIMVLFLFVIMFLNPRALEARPGGWSILAVGLTVLLGGALAAVSINGDPPPDPVAATDLFGSPENLAQTLFSDFVLPFEIASVLLLVAMVGAVVLAKRERS